MASAMGCTRWCACLVVVVCGCGRSVVAGDAACAELLPGDVVITEVLANPDGSDGEDEYIELFNASGRALDLKGLLLVSSRDDGTGATEHRMGVEAVAAGEYLVVGNAPPQTMPPHVDYSYGSTLGSLRNSNARIVVRCEDAVIDEVTYERTADGRALELDGSLVPNHLANDDINNWCASPASADELSVGGFGTPGAANSPCKSEVIEGTCVENGASRAVLAPSVGDVWITEWMANPEGDDDDFEWVEVLFTAHVDLNCLQLGSGPDALGVAVDEEDCFSVDAGTRVVFGASSGAAPRVDAELGFSLGNTGSRSIAVGIDDVVLDQVDYDTTTEGIAWQVDSDDEVCLVSTNETGHEYAPGNFGTPGEANPRCPPVLGPGMCLDDGVPRAIVMPTAGQVQITEWMANPDAVGDPDGEWVEARFDAAIDLNGLVLSDSSTTSTKIEDEKCLSVAPGAPVVFARNTNESENGELQNVRAEFGFSLNNSHETIAISVGGVVLDSVAYASSTAGVATQIDDLGVVCDAVSTYGAGDWGTPGVANPACM